MTKLVEMVKMFILSIVVAVMLFPAMTCQAYVTYQMPKQLTDLKWIVGNWYDTNGNLVLSISNDYKINGCTVMSVDFTADTAGIYKIVINEGNGNKNIELWHTGSQAKSYHEMLVIWTSNTTGSALRRTKNPQYFESIGGIYLGMDKNQVVSLYGQPLRVENQHRYSTWKYSGFEVSFEWNVVIGITIYPNGDRRFDWSGLSANSSNSDFAYKYNTDVTRRGNLNIGHGELINLGQNSVSLRIFTSGYVF